MTLPPADRLDILDVVIVTSVLLIVTPAVPIAIRTATAITQTLRRTDDGWRISRRTVAPPDTADAAFTAPR